MRLALASLAFMLIAASPARAAGLDALSNADMVTGLKDALTQGAAVAVKTLGKQDGFFGNDKVKIPLPENLKTVEKTLRTFGMGKYADELVLTMNRAAEAAVPEAKALLVDAVKKMSVEDARKILTGPQDAATRYFKRTTSPRLREKFLPIVSEAVNKVGAARAYNDYAGQAAQFGLIEEKDARIEDYVTRKALDGLFLMIAEEEKAIRKNPVGAATDVAKKVFGALKF